MTHLDSKTQKNSKILPFFGFPILGPILGPIPRTGGCLFVPFRLVPIIGLSFWTRAVPLAGGEEGRIGQPTVQNRAAK